MNAASTSWFDAMRAACQAAHQEGVRHLVRRSRFSAMWIVSPLPGQQILRNVRRAFEDGGE